MLKKKISRKNLNVRLTIIRNGCTIQTTILQNKNLQGGHMITTLHIKKYRNNR